MSCCGQQRQRFSVGTASADQTRRRQADAKPMGPRPSAYAYFQYTGSTGLTVRAPNTRSSYRFQGAGAIVAVDPKDRRALAAVRHLRQVRGP
jgi:hypothetical protein